MKLGDKVVTPNNQEGIIQRVVPPNGDMFIIYIDFHCKEGSGTMEMWHESQLKLVSNPS